MLHRSLAILKNSASLSLAQLRNGMQKKIEMLPEVIQLRKFITTISDTNLVPQHVGKITSFRDTLKDRRFTYINEKNVMKAVDAALMTFLLHVESRVTHALGEAFYTIGPCGEELLSPIGLVLRPSDPMALHYRHLSVNIARQLQLGDSIESILLNRARGYCVSKKDPVTGGVHCALGGCPCDYLVTSTLASQVAPAVGRALGGSLAQALNVPTPFPPGFLSFCSLGDGSVNNGHFLSGENTAEFVAFRKMKVPVLFCLANNGLSISFRNNGYLENSFIHKLQMPKFIVDGNDMMKIWKKTHQATTYVRRRKKPAALLINRILRRFGHAATDRQSDYLTKEEIEYLANADPLSPMCANAIDSGLISQSALVELFHRRWEQCRQAFEIARSEPKISTRSELVERNSAPMVQMKCVPRTNVIESGVGSQGPKGHIMRKHMFKVLDEALAARKNLVYIGEDVRYGGYYMITGGLAKKYPLRTQDFHPDETSLIGIGMGYAQAGLLPIVELPYAKYLDCGMDMFAEAAFMNWMSNGKQPNGMIIRLQGFGRGTFGGNFHTHNALHFPVGVDVVCHSTGRNYAQAMRYALSQAEKGRVVKFVDSTELLNVREFFPITNKEFQDFSKPHECVSFDQVFLYRSSDSTPSPIVVVTYGNGVVSGLIAQKTLRKSHGILIDILDCPLLSDVPKGLEEAVVNYDGIIFADVCKMGPGQPFASHLTHILNRSLAKNPAKVRCVGAARTYNPLGSEITFLSQEDIIGCVSELLM